LTEQGIIQIATLVVGAIVTVMLAFVQRNQNQARKERKEIKEALFVSDENRSTQLNTIHSLVNSTLGREMREKLEAFKELAIIDPLKWQERALTAQKQYDEHQRRQTALDEKRP